MGDQPDRPDLPQGRADPRSGQVTNARTVRAWFIARSRHNGAVTLTLAIDCGGSGIKGSVLDEAGTPHAARIRVPTPYPMPTGLFLSTVAQLAGWLPPADRVTVGLPGMVRHGVVVWTNHYTTVAGPRTRVDPRLCEEWFGFDAQQAIAGLLGIPALVLNDAEVHGAGAITGVGLELALTLGTGLGAAFFDGGRLAPHLEFAHATLRKGRTFDDYIGDHERRRIGAERWSRRVGRVVNELRPVFHWDRLTIGGGNGRRIRDRKSVV